MQSPLWKRIKYPYSGDELFFYIIQLVLIIYALFLLVLSYSDPNKLQILHNRLLSGAPSRWCRGLCLMSSGSPACVGAFPEVGTQYHLLSYSSNEWLLKSAVVMKRQQSFTRMHIIELSNLGVTKCLTLELIKFIFNLRIPSTYLQLSHLNFSFKIAVIGGSFFHFI